MTNRPIEGQPPTVHDHFGRFADSASTWLGSTWALVASGLVIATWAATGPVFHFSDRWAQVTGTTTALVTFLMVFLIQSTQNRDTRAINLKLNELIRAMGNARNQLIDIERLTDLELDALQATFENVKAAWNERQKFAAPGPTEKEGCKPQPLGKFGRFDCGETSGRFRTAAGPYRVSN